MRKNVMLFVFLILGVAVTIVLGYGHFHWESGTTQLRARLEAARRSTALPRFDRCELEGLPAPVQRYFHAVLSDGQSMVTSVNIEQTGTFNRSEGIENWKPFKSTQRVVTRRPGFVWDARIRMMPVMPVNVQDAYIAGEGILHAAVFGLISLFNLRDTGELAKGELMRFFAEAAWYPTALLPSQGVQWEAEDERSARATMEDSGVPITLLFLFNENGLIDTVRAEARGRMMGSAFGSAPWQCRLWNYAIRDSMQVPLEGEAAWLLPDGAKPYWRGQITKLSYEFAEEKR